MEQRKIKVGIIQQSNSSNITENRQRIIEAIRFLSSQGAQLIVNRELHDSLYFCQTENPDLCDLAIDLTQDNLKDYIDVARQEGVVIVVSVFERRTAGLYHNTAIVIEKDGTIAGCYRKMHIPDDPAYYEKFYFAPGDLGFKPIDTSIGKLGLLVCWDQWYPEAARLMALNGAELLIYPTAIGWESTDSLDEKLRQQDAWVTVQRGHAVANGIPVITVNRTGHEVDPSNQTNGIQFWGHSFVAGPQGELLYVAPDDAEDLKVVEIDLDRSENVRRWWPFLRDRRIDAYGDLTCRYID